VCDINRCVSFLFSLHTNVDTSFFSPVQCTAMHICYYLEKPQQVSIDGGYCACVRTYARLIRKPKTELPQPWRSPPPIPRRRRWAAANAGVGGALMQPLAAGSYPIDRKRSAQASLTLCCKCTFQLLQTFRGMLQ
jgi:hypothetical protein